MLLRKINAVLSLFITFLLMDHAIFHAVWMLSQGSVVKSASSMSWIMLICMMVHAIISIVLAILGHKGAEKRKCNGYFKLNIPTNVQRISGVLMIVFSVLHILGATGVMKPPMLIHAIVPPLFFALSLAHVSVSASKALITLGIGSTRLVKVIDVAVKLLCIVTLILDVIGFYLYRL